jgi:hypothetical protein
VAGLDVPPNALTPKYVENFTFADGSSLTLDQVLAQGVHVIAFTDPFFGGPSINRRICYLERNRHCHWRQWSAV